MVLTEKDYIDFVISLNKGDEKISLPTVVRKALATTPLLFVGYRLEDISFRVIFQGVISFLGVKRPKISIAVQLPPNFSDEKKEKAQNYLTQYTKNMFEISVHWGNTDEFMKELHERLDKFRSHRNKK
jgi:SIR2-like domain